MELEILFDKAFDDENLQSRFYYELLQEDIYVLGEASDSDAGRIEEGSELRVLSLVNEGVRYVPVFLSFASMELFLDGQKYEYLKAKGNDLLETLKAGNIVINPGRENSMVLYSDEIQYILSQGKN